MTNEENYKKIMIPLDGSKYSQSALKVAIEIARKFDSSLYLVTVVDISEVSPPGALLGLHNRELRKSLIQIRSAVRYKVEKTLLENVAICKKNGIETHYNILEGRVADELLNFIKKANINLVVIGSQGLSGIDKLKALGSVSRKISELTRCPVLIMH